MRTPHRRPRDGSSQPRPPTPRRPPPGDSASLLRPWQVIVQDGIVRLVAPWTAPDASDAMRRWDGSRLYAVDERLPPPPPLGSWVNAEALHWVEVSRTTTRP